MDARSLDTIARSLDTRHNRRSVLMALMGGVLGGGIIAPVAVDAKKKSKKDARGQSGKDRDSAVCKANEVQCGPSCCGNGQVCCDSLTGTCVSEGQTCGA